MTERIDIEDMLMAELTVAVERVQREAIEAAMRVWSPFLADYGWDYYSQHLAYESFGAGHVLVRWSPTHEPVVYLPPIESAYDFSAQPVKVTVSLAPVAGGPGAGQYHALKRQYNMAG